MSYLVRFYRREPGNPGAVAGTLQRLEEGNMQETFKSREELLRHLGLDDLQDVSSMPRRGT